MDFTQLCDARLNLRIVRDRSEPRLGRLANVEAEAIHLQLKELAELILVHDYTGPRLRKVETLERIPCTLVVNSEFALMEEGAS